MLAWCLKRDKPIKRFVCLSNNYGILLKNWFPKEAGFDYEMPETQSLWKGTGVT